MKNIKKITLLSLVLFSFFAVQAQSSKSKKHKKTTNKETIAKAKFTKQEATKKLLRDSVILSLHAEDSTRLAIDSIKNIQNDSARLAYKENGAKAIDSVQNVQYAILKKEQEQWYKTEKYKTDIAGTAKLSDYKTKQVKYINETYSLKAKVLTKDTDLQSKATELVKLNDERRNQIKAVVGKHKEKVLEKERKIFIKNNGATADMEWIDIAESVAKK